MMSTQTNILLSLICLILVGHSWYIHFIVKDGLARLMLLWGCALLFAFLAFRVLNFLLVDFGVLNIETSKVMATYNVWFIYALVIGQYILQHKGGDK